VRVDLERSDLQLLAYHDLLLGLLALSRTAMHRLQVTGAAPPGT
jgi:hypothetical protein